MARPLRIEYKGVFYHTTSRGNERRRICFAELDYGRFKEKGRRYHCQFVLIQGLVHFRPHFSCIFIISNTRLPEVSWWGGGMTKEQFEDRHVLFMQEDKASCIDKLLAKALQ